MSEHTEQFFSIGEFAKLFHISKQTLFYYERNRIFIPQFVDTNGYRYYSLQQYFIFEIIIALRKLDIPLKKIAYYIQHRNAHNLQSLFTERYKEYSEQIALMKQNQECLGTKIRQMEAVKKIRIDKITLEDRLKEYLVVSSISSPASALKTKIEEVARHNLHFIDDQIMNQYVMGYILAHDKLLAEEYSGIDRIFTQVSFPEKYKDITVKPAGLYATIFKPNGYHTHYKNGLQKLTEFISRNDLYIVGDAYISQLRNYWSTADPKEYVTRIDILVDYKE